MKLYEISDQFKEVQNLEGVSEEALADTLDMLSGEFEDKAKAVVAYILNEASDIEALKAHKKDIDAKIKAITSRNDSLKDYLRHNMEKCGITEISSPLFKAKLGKASKVVVIDDEGVIPKEYQRVTVAPDKNLIANTLKAGDDVPGAHLEDGKPRLTIK